jgi:hypothetical protein
MTKEAAADEPGRVRVVVEWVGLSPHGFAVIDVRAEPKKLPPGFPRKLRLTFPMSELPYKSGAHFWMEALP